MKKLILSVIALLAANATVMAQKNEKIYLFDKPKMETISVNGVSFVMISVEGGIFMMGAKDSDEDAYSEEYPRHKVTLNSYKIAQTEVTQALWQAVMGSNPSRLKNNSQCPVENVSWNDCQTFIRKINQLTGKKFRLPTEAEWEFAARGGRHGSDSYTVAGCNNDIDESAWYEDNSGGRTHPVGTKEINELYLYDMSGNVSEWCQDWFKGYGSSASVNPTGPTTGTERIVRGGSFESDYQDCRITSRDFEEPDEKEVTIGLRLAL